MQLFADQYDVTTYGYGPSPDPRVRHLQLDDRHRLHRWRRRDLILRRYRRMYWGQGAIRQAKSDLTELAAFDVILANDIDSVALALSLKPRHGTHADIHEYAPRQNEELLVWRGFEAPYMRWMCRHFLPGAASMTTVGQGLADEYRRVFKVDPEIVTNAAPYAALEAGTVGSPIRLVHSGASLRNRRLETLVDAVANTTTDVSLDLFLMGNDPEYVEQLRERAGEVGPHPRARTPPVRPADSTAQRVRHRRPCHRADQLQQPLVSSEQVLRLRAGGLGLIIGPSAEMQRLLAEHRLGAVSEDFGTAALTTVLDSLTADEVRAWKSNASDAARTLSSESQVQVWDDAIRKILGSARRD